MNTTTHPTLDDIVFENRNRAYGAYMLRKLYKPTLTRAAGIGVGLFCWPFRHPRSTPA